MWIDLELDNCTAHLSQAVGKREQSRVLDASDQAESLFKVGVSLTAEPCYHVSGEGDARYHPLHSLD